MFKTRIFWYEKDNGDFAEREHATEAAARLHAAERSKAVGGGLYVLRGETPLAWYENGIDTMAKTAVA